MKNINGEEERSSKVAAAEKMQIEPCVFWAFGQVLACMCD